MMAAVGIVLAAAAAAWVLAPLRRPTTFLAQTQGAAADPDRHAQAAEGAIESPDAPGTPRGARWTMGGQG